MVATGYQFGRCLVSQMNQSFPYDCEYFGSVERPVFMPVTERAFLALTSAVKSFHCGVLSGPAGTGKSQTVTDLSVVSICLFLFLYFIFFIFRWNFRVLYRVN